MASGNRVIDDLPVPGEATAPISLLRIPVRRTTLVAVTLATAASALAAPASAAWAADHQAAPKPASSEPSPLYPNLGNKGYTVDSYDLSMRYQPQDQKAPVAATAVIKAKASEKLSSFTLDAAGLDVTSVTVDGKTAAFAPDAAKEKLSVTPEGPVENGHEMKVEIAYTVNPQGEDAAGSRRAPRPASPSQRSRMPRTPSSPATTSPATRRTSHSTSRCRATAATSVWQVV